MYNILFIMKTIHIPKCSKSNPFLSNAHFEIVDVLPDINLWDSSQSSWGMEFLVHHDPPPHGYSRGRSLVFIIIRSFAYTRFIICACTIISLGVRFLTIICHTPKLIGQVPTIGIQIHTIGLDPIAFIMLYIGWQANVVCPSCSHLLLAFFFSPQVV